MTDLLSALEARLERALATARRLPHWLFAALILFALALTVFGRVLARPGLMVSGSDFLQFYYWEAFTRAELAAGRLPVWNPYFFAGYPAAADPQMLLFYPPAVVLRLLPLSYAFGLGIWLHMGWAGLGMYQFTRRQGLGGTAGLAAGVAFMMSGVYVSHIQGGHLEWLYTIAWLPWVLLTWGQLLDGGGWRSVALTGLTSALMILGGALRVLACAALMGFCLGLFWLAPLAKRRAWKVIAQAAGRAAAAGGLAFGLAAPQLLPTLELASLSSRAAGLALSCTTQFSLVLGDLASLGLARFAQPPFLEWERTAYIGAVGLALAVIGAVGRRAGPWRWLCLAWMAAGLLLGLGPALPVYPLARLLLPVLALVRQPFTFIVLIAFGGAGLAGLGAEALLDSTGPRRLWPLAVAVGLLLVSVLADWSLYRAQPAPTDRTFFARLAWVAGFTSPRSLLGLAVVAAACWRPLPRLNGALLTAALLADLWLFSYVHVPILTAVSPAQQAAYFPAVDPREGRVLSEPYMFSDQSMAVRVANVQGYAPIVVSAYDDFVTGPAARDACPSFEHANIDSGDTALLQALSVQAVVGQAGVTRAVPTPGPRAWWVGASRAAGSAADAVRQSRSPGFDLYTTVILEGAASPEAAPIGGRADVTAYDSQTVALSVDAPAAGWVVLNDVWYPGWEARVNGQSAPVLRANGAFRAVAVPAGRSTVQLTFNSRYLLPGAGLSAMAVLVLAACLLLPGRIRTPASSRP